MSIGIFLTKTKALFGSDPHTHSQDSDPRAFEIVANILQWDLNTNTVYLLNCSSEYKRMCIYEIVVLPSLFVICMG